MPPSACAEQVGVRLKPGFERAGDETSGYGYRCCVNCYRTVLSPIVRDFTHKNCVPKDVHAELEEKFAAAKAKAERTSRQAAAASPECADPPLSEAQTPPTVVRPKEVQLLDGSDDTRRSAARHEAVQRYRASRIQRLEVGLQDAAEKLREAEHEQRAALAAEKKAKEARERAE
eukprot:520371-Prymnesium_polylepis.1